LPGDLEDNAGGGGAKTSRSQVVLSLNR